MRSQCRILVTGAGSGVGQSIIKSLRISKLPLWVVSADISLMNSALYRADESIIIPRVEQSNALELIIELLHHNRIDVVMIGSEFDIEFFSLYKEIIESSTGVSIIVAPPSTVAIANDKWLTAEFLRKNGLPYAESHLPTDQEDAISCAKKWGFPVVLKSRSGTSSRHVHIVRDSINLKEIFTSTPQPMLQRMINLPSSDLGNEYTCSVFKSAHGSMIGPFTARRTIRGGTSWHIEVAPFEELYETLNSIASSLDYIGSLNIQLMISTQGPIPFELNSRFSGTTAVRAHFGFNEPEMAILSFFYKEAISTPKVRSGVAMRYHEEVFIENVSAQTLSLSDKGFVNTWF